MFLRKADLLVVVLGLVVLVMSPFKASAEGETPLLSSVENNPNASTEIKRSFRIKFTFSTVRSVYLVDTDGFFSLKETYAEMKVEPEVDGVKEAVEETVETDLPNIEKGEYDRMKILKKANGDVYLLTDFKYDNGFGKAVGFEKELKLEFIDGNLEDLASGKLVTFEYSNVALFELKKMMEDLLTQEFRDGLLLDLIKNGLTPNKLDCTVKIEKITNSVLDVNNMYIKETSTGPMVAIADVEMVVSFSN